MRWPFTSHRLPPVTLLWGTLFLLMTLGLATSLVDLAGRPAKEILDANRSGQRVMIDPATGMVSGGDRADEAAAAFDIGPDDESEEEADTATKEPVGSTPAPEPVTSQTPPDAPLLRTTPDAVSLPDLPRTHESTVLPPAPEITDISGKLSLPKRGANDITPAMLYAKRFQRQKDMHYISFVITDAGFNDASVKQMLDLPRDVAIALSPYALDAEPYIALLRTAGFETWGMLPTQTKRYPQDDPGPLGLIVGQEETEQRERLHETLHETLGAVGYVLPPEDSFSTSKDFEKVVADLESRGLFLLSTYPARSVEELTKKDALQAVIRRADMVLDSTGSAAFLQSKLASIPKLAEQQPTLIVVASARPQTLSMLAEWLKTTRLPATVKLAPLSAMYGPDEPSPPPEAPKASGGHGGGDSAEKESSGGH